MRRIGLVLALSLFVAPLASEAQDTGKVWRIGYLGNYPPTPNTSRVLAAFTDGLREYGYVEGKNLTIEFRFAHGREERYPELVRELLQANVELVVTVQTSAALALKQGAQALPVVLLGSGNPVEAGLVQSLARPGGGITGLSNQVGDLDGKLVQLARELVPRLSRLTVLWDPTNHPSAYGVNALKALAAKEGLSVSPVSTPAQTPDELERAISALARERPDVLLVHGIGTYIRQAAVIGQLATRHRILTICAFSSMARAGLLISYGPDSASLFRRGAYYVDRIFKGAKPADLPVEQPTKFELVINLKTAKALGLTIPQSVLLRADHVIE